MALLIYSLVNLVEIALYVWLGVFGLRKIDIILIL